jgi:RNA polymerase sigma-70 factor (ECF subfamily)
MDGELSSDEQLTAHLAQRYLSPDALRTAQQACHDLYERHANKLLAFLATRVHRSHLDDIHQEVWRRVWQHAPKQFRGGNFRAWLFTLARNCIIDQSRRKTAEALPAGKEPADERRPDAVLLDTELQAALHHCLEKVTPEATDLVRARLAGESYEDICRRTGMKSERAHKLFHEAKTFLQSCVERSMA